METYNTPEKCEAAAARKRQAARDLRAAARKLERQAKAFERQAETLRQYPGAAPCLSIVPTKSNAGTWPEDVPTTGGGKITAKEAAELLAAYKIIRAEYTLDNVARRLRSWKNKPEIAPGGKHKTFIDGAGRVYPFPAFPGIGKNKRADFWHWCFACHCAGIMWPRR